MKPKFFVLARRCLSVAAATSVLNCVNLDDANSAGHSELAQIIVGNPVPISPTDDTSNDNNGMAVAIDGATALIGAPGHSWGSGPGAAHIWHFNGSTWDRQQMLAASSSGAGSYGRFGSATALSDDWAIVGARDFYVGAGAAFVFHRDPVQGWMQVQELTASLPSRSFGASAAMSGVVAVVGSFQDDGGAGAAYVYHRVGTQWTLEQRLVAPIRSSSAYFGLAVGVSNDAIVVGSNGDDTRALDAGAAYVFRYDGLRPVGSHWNLEQILFAADAAASDGFGRSVSIKDDLIAVGAIYDGDKGVASGSAYLYRFNGTSWTQSQKLVASTGRAGDYFGASVAVSGQGIFVGATGWDKDAYTLFAGTVYAFYPDPSGSMYLEGAQNLLPPSSGSGYQFGQALAVSGDRLLVGTPMAGYPGRNSGVVFAYSFSSTVGCTLNSDCDDGNVCTTDSCASGVCQHANNTLACTDDGNSCTSDVCNGSGVCTHPNNTASCSDGNACTTGDVCSAGACIGAATLSCNDGNACTNDSCNPASGCAHANNTSSCTDSLYCNGADSCSGGTCSIHAGSPCPGADGDANCAESCNESVDACTAADPNGAICNDGNAGTTGDMCSSGVCGGMSINCDDGNPCTTDTISGGVCAHTNNANTCSDSNACTTGDLCSAGACMGAALNCNDGDSCTADSCSAGVCQHQAISCGDTMAPTVGITSPLTGAYVYAKSTITIAAAASDDRGVTRVEFYVDGVLKCTDTASSYTCGWRVPAPRTRSYRLTARAYDAAGKVGASKTVTVTSR